MASSTQSQLEEIDDPNEYKQKRRIKGVLDARERVLDRRGEALDAYFEGLIDQQGFNTILREAVERYIIEIKDRLLDHDDAEEYWQERQLGTLYVPEKDAVYPFIGLHSIIESQNPLSFQVEIEEDSLAEGARPDLRTIQYQIPEDVLMKAFMVTNEFISKIGFDVSSKESRPYDDWREEFEDGVYREPSDVDLGLD